MSSWIDRAIATRAVDADGVPTNGNFRTWKFIGASLTPSGEQLIIEILGGSLLTGPGGFVDVGDTSVVINSQNTLLVSTESGVEIAGGNVELVGEGVWFIGAAAPTDPTHLANKAYVDSVAGGGSSITDGTATLTLALGSLSESGLVNWTLTPSGTYGVTAGGNANVTSAADMEVGGDGGAELLVLSGSGSSLTVGSGYVEQVGSASRTVTASGANRTETYGGTLAARAQPADPVASTRGVTFGGSQSYYGPASAGASLGTARLRFRLDALPTTGFKIIAGTSTGSSGGWLACWEDTYTGSLYGQLTIYVGISSVLTLIGRKFFMPADVGRTFTLHIVCDGVTVCAYLDGRRIAEPVAATSIDSTSNRMNIGANSSGTNSSDNITVIDAAEGPTGIGPAEVLADARASSPSFVDQTHRWTADSSPGATWADEVGTYDLTRFGSPTLTAPFTPTPGAHRRSIEIWGDSIAAGRQADNTAGDGWNRAFQRALPTTYGITTTWVGRSPKDSTATRDFDLYTSATGGEALYTRLSTFAADVADYAPPDTATILAYGINDLVALNRTASQLRADVRSAVRIIAARRPGAPIFVANILAVSTASATAPQHAKIDAYVAEFPFLIASLQATWPQVVSLDYRSAVTDPNDTAQLYDGVHPTPATYTAIAALVATQVAPALSPLGGESIVGADALALHGGSLDVGVAGDANLSADRLSMAGRKVGFFGTEPVAKPAALTAAVGGTINSGDATTDTEIANMRTRIAQLESKLQSLGLLS